MSLNSHPTVSSAEFPTTHWSLIVSSRGQNPDSTAALEELCRAYWPPLYAFMRRKGVNPHDAQDLVQSFIQRLLERGDLANVSAEKGRFRTYLLTALRNYMIKQAEHDKALKRGGGIAFVSIDISEMERLTVPDLSVESPEAAFDRQWARTTLRRALDRLRAEHLARNKEAFFEELAPFLEGGDQHNYELVAQRLGMKKGAVAVAVHRMRSRLQELFHVEVLKTVGSSADADTEARELLEALTRR